MFDTLLSVIAPHVCLDCSSEGAVWCEACSELAPLAPERYFRCHALSPGGRTCPTCRRATSLYAVVAATRYEGTPKQLVWKLKFERAPAAARDISRIMAHRLPVPADVLVVPAPTSTSHVRKRGYDQARLIARQFARLTGAPYADVLMRLGQAEQHTAARVQRLTQLRQAFQVRRVSDVRGRHIVLIDDVITTGATLDAAAKALKTAGAKRVSAIVFAQA